MSCSGRPEQAELPRAIVRGMRRLFTEDFFKNLIGFGTILVFAMAVTILADRLPDGSPQPPIATQTASSH